MNIIVKCVCIKICFNVVTKSHKDNSDNGSEFMHVCTIVIFLLIKFLYSSIHSLNCLFQFTQFYSVLVNFINFIMMFSLIAYFL